MERSFRDHQKKYY